MNNFKNMKIEIKDAQPLGEVVRELGRLGFKKDDTLEDGRNFIYAYVDNTYVIYSGDHKDYDLVLTTLAELKEME